MAARLPALWLAFIAALGALALLHVSFGTVAVPFAQVLGVLTNAETDKVATDIVWNIRSPRVLVVIAAGAMLGLAGALLQAVTRNPLAEPGLLGVSGGAVLAIVTVIIVSSRLEGLGIVRQTGLLLPIAGVAGGLAAGALTYALSWRRGSDAMLLVLMGVLVAGACGALTSVLLLTADENQVQLVLQWTVGSTNGRVWVHWGMLWPFALVGLAGALAMAALVNALQLGDGVTAGLGVSVERAKFGVLTASAVLTAGAVSVVGAVGFIGLIGPHLARLVSGSDARRLLPTAMLLSALVLLAADLVARTAPLHWLSAWTRLDLPGHSGLPVGVITPLIGVPFFLWLLLAGRGRGLT
jgi:iron complex transport system permease protein